MMVGILGLEGLETRCDVMNPESTCTVHLQELAPLRLLVITPYK